MKNEKYQEQFAYYYIRDLEVTKNLNQVASFFDQQDLLIESIIKGKEAAANGAMEALQDILITRAPNDTILALSNYYITLVALFSNELRKYGVAPIKVFCFASACIDIFKHWQTEEELLDGGKWLVSSLSNIIQERLYPNFKNPIVNKAVALINRRIEEPIEVEHIAEELSVSPSYLAKLFKQEVGSTVKQFSNMRKIEEAKHFLRYSESTIVEVSDMFSFCNQSYFTKVFKEQVGQTPRQYRVQKNDQDRRNPNKAG